MQSMAPPQRYVERDNFRRVVCAAVLLVFLLCTLWTVTGCARPAAPPDQLDTGRRNGASECFPYAAPDRFYNDLFTRGDGGWTGGDGTRSVSLPDGRILWLFGDTFLGTVRPDRSRLHATPMVRNTFVVQSGDTLVTLHGGTEDSPQALVTPLEKGSWYWPSDGLVEGNRLLVFLPRFTATGPGMWDWRWSGTDIGTFSLPELRLEKITAAVAVNRVIYGAALLKDADATYIYGVEDLQSAKHVHVAKAGSGHLEDAWEYWDGERWTVDPLASKRLFSGAALQFGVIKTGDRYVLITSDNRNPFDSAIVAYVSPSPTGPWSLSSLLYRPPEAKGEIVAYNALAHPHLSPRDRLLLSYNLNHIRDAEAVFRNADVYRPRFVLVDLKAVRYEP
ncbi:MAG: DUF5005 domain-containing protein [Desulfobacterales bacterium]